MSKFDTLNMAALEDARFVRRLTRLDVAAFEQLYDETSPAVYGHLVHVAQNVEIAESLLVETFYRAWARMHSFHGERGALPGWLISIANDLLQQELPVLRHSGSRAA
ncbi:MAG: hypothetical protein IT335_09795 [Thermomicrobiales bacterium]|jgi:DNA-directed RNA polymerase specialized sigma24 family protein|nr:hypothetical protein [Thermomicrobiales bacterium]